MINNFYEAIFIVPCSIFIQSISCKTLALGNNEKSEVLEKKSKNVILIEATLVTVDWKDIL